jgi:N-acetylglucosaminyl-diphospho-decaprenol L-rhamnosyltransferase
MRLDVSAIVVNWNTHDLLAQCLASLLDTIGSLDMEVLVVDNASSDGSQAMVRSRFPDVRLIENRENVGFARANNQATALSRGRYMLMINSDAIATPGAIQSMVDLADAESRAGIVGAQLLNPDGSFQASHTSFPTLWQEFLILTGLGRLLRGRWYPSRGPTQDRGPQIVDYVEGACLLVRRQAIEEVGGLDEGYFMYAEEVDWCYAMKQGDWQVWYQPNARIIHYGGASSCHRRTQREADLYRSRVRFFRKHYGDRAAIGLKMLIYGLTVVKIVIHRPLRLISRNRRGRAIVSMNDLIASLRQV